MAQRLRPARMGDGTRFSKVRILVMAIWLVSHKSSAKIPRSNSRHLPGRSRGERRSECQILLLFGHKTQGR